ncbi:RNA polymerase sigma factor [Candidatus Latescibacterota bacterium]
MPRVLQALEEALTPRQGDVVRMYFLDELTVYEIAERLGVSATCVIQHLFGRSRGGKRVGGALPKLRKAMEAHSQ